MAEAEYQVRLATASEIPLSLEIAAAVQDKLTCAGSVQQIAGYTSQNAMKRVQHSEMFVLEVSGQLFGSAFVEPVTLERFSRISAWNVIPDGHSAWFLYGLVVAPAFQGQGLGRILLDGICCQSMFASSAMLLLDCWTGNYKLRQFYLNAGFELHGEFAEEDYRVAVFRRTVR